MHLRGLGRTERNPERNTKATTVDGLSPDLKGATTTFGFGRRFFGLGFEELN